MPNCTQLLSEVERYRQNWLTKHKVSCKGNQHSSQCKAAYAKYQQKLAAWASQCKKRFDGVTEESLSFEVYSAFEEDLVTIRDE